MDQKRDMRILTMKIDGIEDEAKRVERDLKVATNKNYLQSNARNASALKTNVVCNETVRDGIKALRSENSHLKEQMKHLEARKRRLDSHSISAHQNERNFQREQGQIRVFRNRLELLNIKGNSVQCNNSQLSLMIQQQLGHRTRFNTVWKQMTDRLSYRKKILVDMVDQVISALDVNAEVGSKMNAMISRAAHENQSQKDETIDLLRKSHFDATMQKHFSVIGHRRSVSDFEPREHCRRDTFKIEHSNRIATDKFVLERLFKIFDRQIVANIDSILNEFRKQQREYFSYFSHANGSDCLIDILRKHQSDFKKEEPPSNPPEIHLNHQIDIEAKRNKLIVEEKHFAENVESIEGIARQLKLQGQLDSMNEINIEGILSALEARARQILCFDLFFARGNE